VAFLEAHACHMVVLSFVLALSNLDYLKVTR